MEVNPSSAPGTVDIPADARSQLKFVWMEQIDDALGAALTSAAVGHVAA